MEPCSIYIEVEKYFLEFQDSAEWEAFLQSRDVGYWRSEGIIIRFKCRLSTREKLAAQRIQRRIQLSDRYLL